MINEPRVVERIDDGICRLDTTGRLQYVNHTAAQALGFPPAMLLGHIIWEVAVPLGEGFAECCRASLADDLPRHCEMYCSSQCAWYDVRALPTDAGLIVTFQAITPRKQAAPVGVAQTEREWAFAAMTQALASVTSDDQATLETATRFLSEIIGDTCSIDLLSPAGGWQEHAAVSRRDLASATFLRNLLEGQTHSTDQSVIQRLLQTGEPLVFAVASSEPLSNFIPPNLAEEVRRYGFQSLMIVPLRVQGQTLGTIAMLREVPDHAYQPEDIALVQALAGHVALAIANAHLERNLVRLHQQLAAIGGFSPDALIGVDETQRICVFNPVAEQLFGYTAAEILGQPLDLVIPDHAQAMHHPINTSATVRRFTVEGGFIWGRRRDGSEFPIDGLISQVVVDGLMISTVCLRDVRGAQQAAQELQLLKLAVQHTTEAVLITSADLDVPGPEIIFVNPALCAMTGYTADEILGHNPRMFQGQATDQGVLVRMRTALAAGEPFQAEVINYRKDGSPYYLEWATAPIRDATGTLTHFVALQRDISARKQIDLQLRYSEDRLRRMIDRLQNLYEIGQAILSATSLEMIAQRAVRHIVNLIPCSSASMVLLDLDDGYDRTLASFSQGEDESPLNPQSRATDRSAVHGDTTIRYLNVPIMLAQRQIGTLKLEAPGLDGFTNEYTEIAREVTNLLAVAIQNTQLFQQVQAGRNRLAILSRRLIDIQEDERRHLARELHDEIGQVLTAIRLNLHALDGDIQTARGRACLDDMNLLVQNLVQQVRTLSLDLRPLMLDDLGLITTLRWYLDRQTQRSGVPILLSTEDPDVPLDPAIATACFRIVQESLTNIMRHASASRVTVTLAWDDQRLALRVCDNGCGFDPHAVHSQTTSGRHFGILGMQERASLLGGACTWITAPGQGVEVCATFPLGGESFNRRSSAR